ncbi:hypothetical protein L6386_00985 [bacterium]|nr:hypothetical protein [bacterium]MCG2677132.1 hypothetical protein [bacterium]
MAKRKKVKKVSEGMKTVKCAFCDGTGKDPWGVLSKPSICQVCGGKGEVRVEGPRVKCNFCGGSGVEPYTTSRLHCLACGGKGVVTKIEPSRECPSCKGTGIAPGYKKAPLAFALMCQTCRGQGIIPK